MILAGGKGTRLSEYTEDLPKPLVLLDEKPILLHIMNRYAKFGVNEFIILTGYKGWLIKQYFRDFWLMSHDFTVDTQTGSLSEVSASPGFQMPKNWKVTIVDTGLETMTGGRLKRIQHLVKDEDFFFTYGDGVSDVDLNKLVEFHRRTNKTATITAVNPPARFGSIQIEGDLINSFSEKPVHSLDFINGGFMVMKPKIFDYLENDSTVLEREPLASLAEAGDLAAFRHSSFWQCMDTARDVSYLRELIKEGRAPWIQ